MVDLILRNGNLTDPQNGLDGVPGDLAVQGGRIVGIGTVGGGAMQEIDVSGYTVTPGLIDFHAHFFSTGANTSLEFFRYLSDGVTNAVDAGSAGPANLESFLETLSLRERRNTRLYLNLSSEGLSCLGDHSENINPRYFNQDRILRLCGMYSEQIVGLKLRISAEIARESGTTSFEALRRGIEIAGACGLPLSVHMPDFQGELRELIHMLRPGDIFCHVFTPQKGIMVNGAVSREMERAVEKGILLESACGKGHFGHDCARAALQAGIRPHMISGDFTRNTHHYPPAFSLPYLMSRFLALGMSFAEVLACTTTTPAKKMGMEGEIGCLQVGARANITVLQRRAGAFSCTDVRDSTVTGTELLIPMLTLLEGDLVYRSHSSI